MPVYDPLRERNRRHSDMSSISLSTPIIYCVGLVTIICFFDLVALLHLQPSPRAVAPARLHYLPFWTRIVCALAERSRSAPEASCRRLRMAVAAR
eukprot:4633337-Pleurochrysis_carterae.AAC.1